MIIVRSKIISNLVSPGDLHPNDSAIGRRTWESFLSPSLLIPRRSLLIFHGQTWQEKRVGLGMHRQLELKGPSIISLQKPFSSLTNSIEMDYTLLVEK